MLLIWKYHGFDLLNIRYFLNIDVDLIMKILYQLFQFIQIASSIIDLLALL